MNSGPEAGHARRNDSVKLLVFAHKPPPHHGQSYMVQLLLQALKSEGRAPGQESADSIEVFHVDVRLSRDTRDIGQARGGKVFLLLKFCLQAVWCRLRHGVTAFYYVPAPPSRAAIYRDWIVMMLCRPFFQQVVFHWHAVGLGEWLVKFARPWERWITQMLLGKVDLSIVLGEFNRADAQQLAPRRIAVVPNGIPDPCPRFDAEVLPRRLTRIAARKALLRGGLAAGSGGDVRVFKVVFIGVCFSEKGLFDAVEAVAFANQRLANGPIRIKLQVAGSFWVEAERERFFQRIQQTDLAQSGPWVEHLGFVTGEQKARLLAEADCLCFPSYYSAESFGLVLCEAMANGLPIVTTRWRTIPELLPGTASVVVDIQSPQQIADGLISLLEQEYDPALRRRFLEHYTDAQFSQNVVRALRTLGQS